MIEIAKKIYWTGVKDWELRKFHGHELSTHRGTTYNAYVVKDEKTVLVDSVWYPYKEQFVNQLDADVGIRNIDYIVVNHSEPDHAGSIAAVLERNPNATVVCTKNGAEALQRHFHQDWKFHIVKTGDSIKIGEYELVFVEMTMLHWPDSMLTYVKGANIVFSNDAFGQHYSPTGLFVEDTDMCEVWQEAIKYYANIVSPFGPLVKKKVAEIKAMNLAIDMIAPSHGAIWRNNPMQIVEAYDRWAMNYHEGFVSIVYDTMYDATKRIAEAIAAGLLEKGVQPKLFNSAVTDKSDLLTDLFKSRGVIVGSCTVNNTVMASIHVVLEELKALKMKNKFAGAFGTYGWSGESPKIIHAKLKEAGLNVIGEPLSARYDPTQEELEAFREYGRQFAEAMNK